MEPNDFNPTLEPEKVKKGPSKKDLTLLRTRLAQERTLMAWVRTAASFMTFGFALYKLLESRVKEETTSHPILDVITPTYIAIILFSTGFIGLLLATIRHITTMAELHVHTEKRFFSIALILSYVVLILLLLLLYGALRQA